MQLRELYTNNLICVDEEGRRVRRAVVINYLRTELGPILPGTSADGRRILPSEVPVDRQNRRHIGNTREFQINLQGSEVLTLPRSCIPCARIDGHVGLYK